MEFTKRAYVKVWQNCPEDQREDTYITLKDYEDTNELNSIPVALLYLLERHAFVNSMDENSTSSNAALQPNRSTSSTSSKPTETCSARPETSGRP